MHMEAMGDARAWDEDKYRNSILEDRAMEARTVFSTVFAPTTSKTASPDVIVAASSDGSIAPYSIPACISATSSSSYSAYPLGPSESKWHHQSVLDCPVAEPLCSLSGHNGPAYDLKFYGEGEDSLLLSCGDDGRIQGWRWQEISNAFASAIQNSTSTLQPLLEFKNPQQKGPWGALSPMPETNALAIDSQGKRIFSAAGDGYAYCWDMVTGRNVTTFKGHSDYLHCIVARSSQNQVITGSEDGTVRMWDCRTGCCIAILDPFRATKITKQSKKTSPWVSCMALDTSENWLACGSGGGCLTLWSLPGTDATIRIATCAPPQDLVISNNKIVAVGAQPLLSRFSFSGKVISQVSCAPLSAYSVEVHPSGVTTVGGYGGLVDIISEFGSHLCIFRCKGL